MKLRLVKIDAWLKPRSVFSKHARLLLRGIGWVPTAWAGKVFISGSVSVPAGSLSLPAETALRVKRNAMSIHSFLAFRKIVRKAAKLTRIPAAVRREALAMVRFPGRLAGALRTVSTC